MSLDVLLLDEVADILRLNATSTKEKRAQVRALIRDGHLRAINDQIGPARWTVSRYEVERYVREGSARRVAS